MNFVAELPRQAFAGYNLESVPVRVGLAGVIIVSSFVVDGVRIIASAIFLAMIGPPSEEPSAKNGARNIVHITSRVVGFATLCILVYGIAFAFFGHRMV